MLLANLTNGKKEIVLEQLAKKIGVLEENLTECNYAGRS